MQKFPIYFLSCPLFLQKNLKDFGKSLRRLSSTHRVLAVDNEQRDASAIPLLLELLSLVLDLGPSNAFVVEEQLYGFGRHTCCLSTFLEDAWISQTVFVFEIGRKQSIHHFVLELAPADFPCLPYESVAVKGIPDESTVGKVDSDLFADGFHVGNHGLDALGAKFLLVHFQFVFALAFWQTRVELEGTPEDVRVDP